MKTTPLHSQHKELSAKMGEFAGYDMPFFYEEGVMKEHEWVRKHAGLFDVSHMGQIKIEGDGATEFWESVTPSRFSRLRRSEAKYTVLTNDKGGIIDDLIVTKIDHDKFYAVINGSRKDVDIEWLQGYLPENLTMSHKTDRALLALQGPEAAAVLFDVYGLDVEEFEYMKGQNVDLSGVSAFLSRLGYTGEDGFEISVSAEDAPEVWRKILTHDEAKPIGLAARDSLRLEMGYCLYGHDIDETTTPVEAGLSWLIAKNRENYPGAEIIRAQLENGPARCRVGLKLLEKGVAREGAKIIDAAERELGVLTSGGFSPSLKESIGQGYIEMAYSNIDTSVHIDVRGRHIKAVVTKMPFMPPKTKTAKKSA